MQKKTKLLVRIIALVLLVFAYPAFVLGYTWSHVARSNLSGGRDGPLDAYRHTLASAVVAFTLSPGAVDWVTWVMERSSRDSNAMDRHNNQIGVDIGSRVRSFAKIEPTVHAYVLSGTVNASDPLQVTWLPRERWRPSRLW